MAAAVALDLMGTDVTVQLVAADLALLQAVAADITLQLVTSNIGVQGPGADILRRERLRAAAFCSRAAVVPSLVSKVIFTRAEPLIQKQQSWSNLQSCTDKYT